MKGSDSSILYLSSDSKRIEKCAAEKLVQTLHRKTFAEKNPRRGTPFGRNRRKGLEASRLPKAFNIPLSHQWKTLCTQGSLLALSNWFTAGVSLGLIQHRDT